jgi:flagellar biosynthesis protein FlhF
MNVKRFTARTPREALALVRQAFGADAVVLSTRPSAEGVEVLAMAPESLAQIEQVRSTAQLASTPAAPTPVADVQQDVEALSMSTLSFQDYVRERMLKRRQAEIAQPAHLAPLPGRPAEQRPASGSVASPTQAAAVAAVPPSAVPDAHRASLPPMLREEIRYDATPVLAQMHVHTQASDNADSQRHERLMLDELRQVKGLIEERFGALAFMEKLQRSPQRASLTQKLLDGGFSPALIRKLVEALPPDCADEAVWATGVLERNLQAAESEPAIEEAGGTYALIGATGVGKTTSTAKIAAAFATRHGSGNLGLITLDAYRVGAQEQLRTYGRILGVPVHTAHDRASLEDLLDLLSAKSMVLIDTAGMAQRDSRTRELLEMVSHRSIQKLLVVNAAAQGETIEDVMISYHAATCRGMVISKIDEAVKLGPALDAAIRHKLRVIGVANGQRVPEDWHRLSAQALLQRAMRAQPNASWRLDADEVSLVFAGQHGSAARPGRAAAALHA